MPATMGMARCVAQCVGIIVLITMLPAHAAAGQQYYDLDVGRPTRIGDAIPAARYDLDLQLAAVRFERYADGTQRWRFDPKITYGVAPFTEIEIRAPFLVVNPHQDSAKTQRGVGGLAIGAHHAFGLETTSIPALGVSGEWVLPVGNLAARIGSFSVNGLATKTFTSGRIHINAGSGSWSIRRAPNISCSQIQLPGTPPPPGCGGGPFVPDTPCDITPSATSGALHFCGIPAPVPVGAPLDSNRASTGRHDILGVGGDHAWAVHSVVVTADVVMERFRRLYAQTDWTGELGLRHQVAPRAVLDAAVSRHFAGEVQWTALTLGLSLHTPLQGRL